MSQSNGVIRIDKKGKKKFAFGDGEVFEFDVVEVFQKWIIIDDQFRPDEPNEAGHRVISVEEVPQWHQALVLFVKSLMVSDQDITIAEGLEFLARLREEYDKLVDFFHPRSKDEHESPDTSRSEIVFSEEES